MVTPSQGFPAVSQPFTRQGGFINQSWLFLLQSLWNRTGGAGGGSVVSAGGTGRNTLDPHGVLVGAGEDPIVSVDPGAAGNFLGSNGPTNDPSFQPVVVNASSLTGTTLAAGVVNSSLTKVGTLITGVWNATIIAVTKGGTGQASFTAHGVVLGNGSGALAVTAAGTAGQVLTSNGSASDPTYQTPPSAALPVLWVRQEQTSGTAPAEGTFTASAWNKRTINVVKVNTITGASLTTSSVTLPAGTYKIKATSQTYGGSGTAISQAQGRWRNTTDSTTALAGMAAGGGDNTAIAVRAQAINIMSGQFTIAGVKVFEFDVFPIDTCTGGFAMSSGEVEVYVDVYIEKLA